MRWYRYSSKPESRSRSRLSPANSRPFLTPTMPSAAPARSRKPPFPLCTNYYSKKAFKKFRSPCCALPWMPCTPSPSRTGISKLIPSQPSKPCGSTVIVWEWFQTLLMIIMFSNWCIAGNCARFSKRSSPQLAVAFANPTSASSDSRWTILEYLRNRWPWWAILPKRISWGLTSWEYTAFGLHAAPARRKKVN